MSTSPPVFSRGKPNAFFYVLRKVSIFVLFKKKKKFLFPSCRIWDKYPYNLKFSWCWQGVNDCGAYFLSNKHWALSFPARLLKISDLPLSLGDLTYVWNSPLSHLAGLTHSCRYGRRQSHEGNGKGYNWKNRSLIARGVAFSSVLHFEERIFAYSWAMTSREKADKNFNINFNNSRVTAWTMLWGNSYLSVTYYQRGPALNAGFLTFPLGLLWKMTRRLHSGPLRWCVHPMVRCAGRRADVFFCHLVGIITWSHNHSTCQHNKAGGKELGGQQTQETTRGRTGGNKDNSNLQFALEYLYFF